MSQEFLKALHHGDLRVVESMLAQSPGLANAVDPHFGDPVLFHPNGPRIAEILVRYGADVNARSGDYETPLHYAAKYGHAENAEVLIAHGADVNAVDARGFTPLEYAISRCSPEMVRMLLAAGSNYTLIAAIARSDLARVQEIVRKDPNTIKTLPKKDRLALLKEAASVYIEPQFGGVGSLQDRFEIIELLFAHGVDPTKQEIRDIADNADERIKNALLQDVS